MPLRQRPVGAYGDDDASRMGEYAAASTWIVRTQVLAIAFLLCLGVPIATEVRQRLGYGSAQREDAQCRATREGGAGLAAFEAFDAALADEADITLQWVGLNANRSASASGSLLADTNVLRRAWRATDAALHEWATAAMWGSDAQAAAVTHAVQRPRLVVLHTGDRSIPALGAAYANAHQVAAAFAARRLAHCLSAGSRGLLGALLEASRLHDEAVSLHLATDLAATQSLSAQPGAEANEAGGRLLRASSRAAWALMVGQTLRTDMPMSSIYGRSDRSVPFLPQDALAHDGFFSSSAGFVSDAAGDAFFEPLLLVEPVGSESQVEDVANDASGVALRSGASFAAAILDAGAAAQPFAATALILICTAAACAVTAATVCARSGLLQPAVSWAAHGARSIAGMLYRTDTAMHRITRLRLSDAATDMNVGGLVNAVPVARELQALIEPLRAAARFVHPAALQIEMHRSPHWHSAVTVLGVRLCTPLWAAVGADALKGLPHLLCSLQTALIREAAASGAVVLEPAGGTWTLAWNALPRPPAVDGSGGGYCTAAAAAAAAIGIVARLRRVVATESSGYDGSQADVRCAVMHGPAWCGVVGSDTTAAFTVLGPATALLSTALFVAEQHRVSIVVDEAIRLALDATPAARTRPVERIALSAPRATEVVLHAIDASVVSAQMGDSRNLSSMSLATASLLADTDAAVIACYGAAFSAYLARQDVAARDKLAECDALLRARRLRDGPASAQLRQPIEHSVARLRWMMRCRPPVFVTRRGSEFHTFSLPATLA